jgi:hypothetical protein
MPMAAAEDHAQGHSGAAWCRYCAPEGSLQPFEERFERMVQWQTQRAGQSRAEAEAATKTYMRSLPAWRDHPALRERP